MILKVEGPFRTKVEAERAKEHASEVVRMRWNCGDKEYFVIRETQEQAATE